MCSQTLRGFSALLLIAAHCVLSSAAWPFPPYRSTDADTADPYTLELRLGLVKVERKSGKTEIVTPLIRANLGLPNKFEFISEFEYVPEKGELGDGALGIKWVPIFDTVSIGVEALALLPVRPGDDGAGVEAQLLGTYWAEAFRVHVNAGGFHDPRGTAAENGWRASMLVEFPRDGFRPGVELFAKEVSGEATDVRLGAGVLHDVGLFEIRTGLHAGLTSKAPDISFNLWLSTKLPFK